MFKGVYELRSFELYKLSPILLKSSTYISEAVIEDMLHISARLYDNFLLTRRGAARGKMLIVRTNHDHHTILGKDTSATIASAIDLCTEYPNFSSSTS